MGERNDTQVRFGFNGSVRVETREDALTSNAGALLLREFDECLGTTAWLSERIADPRDPRFVQHEMSELLRTRLFLMALGHRDQGDADLHRHDPALRLATDDSAGLTPLDESTLASQPTHSRLVDTLASESNLRALNEGLFEFARRNIAAEGGLETKDLTIDIDSMPVEVHGHQAGSEWNGHYGVRCYHPLVAMLGETGHWLAAELRPGNVHTAEGTEEFLVPLLERVERHLGRPARVRGDAGFPSEDLLALLEKKQCSYVFRVRNNRVLDAKAKRYLRRPRGRRTHEPREWTYDLTYKAGSWRHPRRVVLVVQEREGELFLHHFWLVTNASADQWPAEKLLADYRQRGTMEGHIGELSSVLGLALSCRKRSQESTDDDAAKRRNAATFFLYAHAYNLAHGARRILARESFASSGAALHLGRMRKILLRVAGLVTRSARRAVIAINRRAADYWLAFCRGLARLVHVPPRASNA